MHKIAGYLFIFVGMLLMFFALIGMYKTFANRHPVPTMIQLTDAHIHTQYGVMQIPMQNLNTLANAGLFVIFMLFILSAGSKVAAVGCNLLKNERIYEALLQVESKGKAPAQETLTKL